MLTGLGVASKGLVHDPPYGGGGGTYTLSKNLEVRAVDASQAEIRINDQALLSVQEAGAIIELNTPGEILVKMNDENVLIQGEGS